MKVFISVLGFISLLIGGVMLSSCASLGRAPSDQERNLFSQSKNYNSKKGTFVNRRQEVIEEMKKRNITWKALKLWLAGAKDTKPKGKLPEVKPSVEEFLSPSERMKVIWFGHSSFLLNLNGRTVLVDPVFSGAASPVSFMVKRFQKPVLELEELPEIDYIVISHDHYDHLDMESIKFFKDKKTQFVTPLGVGGHLKKWGISESRIFERDWWESAIFEGITFTATPAQHFSGRTGFRDNETLWASWVIKTEKENIYFSGDSGYDTHFQEIGEKLGPFDLAFIESGQYNELWKEVHMLPDEAVQAYKDLKAKKFFPVHWGMFELAMHPWYEPIEKLYKRSQDGELDLVAPRIGEIINIENSYNQLKWWNYSPAKTAEVPNQISLSLNQKEE